MKRIYYFTILVLVLPFSQTFAASFTVKSPQLISGGNMQNEQVLNGFGCNGNNISPRLDWSGEPAETKSFALTVYDPDAPTGSGWWHWVVFNIPADVHSLAKGVNKENIPAGVIQSRTDFGSPGYGGACPPPGDTPHRYQFTIWALDVEALSLDQDASAAMVGFFLHQHQLGKAELTVSYGR